jgi:hypothetical protein
MVLLPKFDGDLRPTKSGLSSDSKRIGQIVGNPVKSLLDLATRELSSSECKQRAEQRISSKAAAAKFVQGDVPSRPFVAFTAPLRILDRKPIPDIPAQRSSHASEDLPPSKVIMKNFGVFRSNILLYGNFVNLNPR